MGARAKILVVDDSAAVRDATRWTLERAGYDVALLDTPFSFTQALNAEQPSLVLMDLSMPGLTGDKLVEIARRYSPHLCPIVLFSSQPVEELKNVASRLGIAGFIPKGCDNLASEVARFLRQHAESPSIVQGSGIRHTVSKPERTEVETATQNRR